MTKLAAIGHAAWLADHNDTDSAWNAAAAAIVKEMIRRMLAARPLASLQPDKLSPALPQYESCEMRDRRIARAYENYVARLTELSADA
jgi:hypothetical protein